MKSYSMHPLTGLIKPRYKVISTILGEGFNPTNGCDVFIDLNTLISAMASSQKFLLSLPFAEQVEVDIISGVLMTIKHWKDYLRKYEDTRIFLMCNAFNTEGLEEHKLIKSYLIPYQNKFESNRYKQLVYYWEESLKRLEVILKYIPNVYIFHCNRFDSYILPNIIDNYDSNKRIRIILSGSPLMTNYTYMKNTKVIYTRYKHTGMCQISDPLMIVQSLSKIDEDIMETFTKNKVFYNLLNLIIGDFDRGIIGMTNVGITNFATTLLRGVEQRSIPEDPKTIDSVLKIIDDKFQDHIKKTYPLVDIDSHTNLVNQSIIEKTKSTMIDLYDIDGLRSLNIEGLNLIELL